MTKRFLAALTAFAMCASAAGCGNTEKSGGGSQEQGGASLGETTRREDVADADEKSPDEEVGASDSEAEDKVGSGETSAEGFEIAPANIILTNLEARDMPSSEEAAQLMSLALQQYRAAYEDDAESFVGLMELELTPDRIADVILGDRLQTIDETPAKYSTMSMLLMELYFLGGNGVWELLDVSGREIDRDEYIASIREAIGNIDVQSEYAAIELGYTFDTIQALQPWTGADENTAAWMEVKNFERDGEDLYITFDMGVYSGMGYYEIQRVYGWRIDGVCGVLLSDADMEDSPCSGMTLDETRAYAEAEAEKRVEEDRIDRARFAAKFAYNSLAELLATGEFMGWERQEFLDANFKLLTSDKGLDLTVGVPSATGDKRLYEDMHLDGFAGVLTVSDYDPSDESGIGLTVYYTSIDGTAGQYPEE